MSITSVRGRPPAPPEVSNAAARQRPGPPWLESFVAGMTSARQADRTEAHFRLSYLYAEAVSGKGSPSGPDPHLRRQIVSALGRETGRGGRLHRVPEAHFTYAQVLVREGRYEEARREFAEASRLAGGGHPWLAGGPGGAP